MNEILAWLDGNRRSLQRDGRTRSVVLERRYRYPLDELWSAFTDRARLARWFADVQGELTLGASLRIDAGMPHTISSRVVACTPPRADDDTARLVITWSYDGDPIDPPDEVEAVLKKDGEASSILTLAHRSTVEYPWAPGVGSGWESWLWGLDRALSRDDSGPPTRGAPDDVNASIDRRWSVTSDPTLIEATAVLERDVDGDRSRNTLRLTRRYAKPREEVWAALTSPSSFARWYPARLEGELVAGREIRFIYEDGSALAGKVIACEPPALLAFREDRDDVKITLRPEGRDGKSTLLVFTHAFDAPATVSGAGPGAPPPSSMAAGWDGCLEELTRALHDQPPVPDDERDARSAALRAIYATLFRTQ